MWSTIALITSGLTLVAFLAATISAISKAVLRRDQDLISNANPDDRPKLIAQAMERFSIDGNKIKSEEARERLMLEQMRTRMTRYTQTLIVSLIAFSILAILAGFTIYVHYSRQIESSLPVLVTEPTLATEPTARKPTTVVAPEPTLTPAPPTKEPITASTAKEPIAAPEPTVATEPTTKDPAMAPEPTARSSTSKPTTSKLTIKRAGSNEMVAGRGKWRQTFHFKAGKSYDFRIEGAVKSKVKTEATFALKLCTLDLDRCEKEQSTILFVVDVFQDLGIQSETKYATDTAMIVVLENGSSNPVYLSKGSRLIVEAL